MVHPTIKEILLASALHFEMSIAELCGPSRERKYARPRQIAMYMAYVLGAGTLAQIGYQVGYRDHTTVLHAVRNISRLLAFERGVIDAIAEIHIIAARMVRTRDREDFLEAVA